MSNLVAFDLAAVREGLTKTAFKFTIKMQKEIKMHDSMIVHQETPGAGTPGVLLWLVSGRGCRDLKKRKDISNFLPMSFFSLYEIEFLHGFVHRIGYSPESG